MRRGKLFASILAVIAALSGVSMTATDTPGSAYARAATAPNAQTTGTVQAQRDGTKTVPATPAPNANVQNLRAGATIVPLYIPGAEPIRRYAWVGRKVGGRYGYYTRPVYTSPGRVARVLARRTPKAEWVR